MAIRILSGENITGDITTSGKVNAGDRILTEATTSNALLQVKYNSSNYLEGYYDKLNVVGGDFLLQRSGDTKILLTAVGTTFTNLSNTSAASSTVDEVKIGSFGAGRPAIFLGTSNTTYTNSTWFIENIGASGKFRIGRNGLDILEIENNGASLIKGPSLTVIDDSDPSVAVSDTDTNYKGIMTWRNSGSENVLEFITRYAGTYYTNNLVLDRGKVGIGTGSPGRKLTVTGDVSGDANNLLLSNENDTNGDSASIGFSMLSNNTYVKAGIFFQRITTQGRGDLIFANNNEVNGNNVGITNEIMSIRNTGAIEIKGTSTTLNGKAFITNTDALMTIGSTQSSGVPKDMAFFNGGERMRIQATTGNVGIGTTSPNKTLHVVGDQLIFGNLLLQSNANGFRTIALNTTDGADNQELYLCGGATASSTRGGQVGVYGNEVSTTGGSVVIVAGNVSTGDIDFLTANTQRMIINNAGNVGIATTSPPAKLSVVGSGENGGILFNNSGAQEHRFYSSANSQFNAIGSGSPIWYWAQYTGVGVTPNYKMTLDNTGLGIGTTSPTNIIHTSTSSNTVARFESTDANAHIRINDTDDSFYLVTANQKGSIGGNSDVHGNNLNIDLTNGKVGIGVTSPPEKLSVAGNIAIDNGNSFMVGGGTGDTIIGRLGNASGVLNLQAESTRSIRLGNVSQGELVRIDAYNQRVGIGTTNPGEKLHVNGRTILQNTEYVDYATGSINTTGVVMATVPASTNGQSVLLTFEATGGTGSVYSVIYSCYNGGGTWYYTKNVLIFGGNIEVAETNGSGSSTLSFSFRATSGSAAYTPRVVMKGNPYGLVSFI